MRDTEVPGPEPEVTGPILFARGADDRRYRLAALLVLPEDREPPALEPEGGEPAVPIELDRRFGRAVWRYDFALPVGVDAGYRLGGREYRVATDLTKTARIAYVSCNGQENGDIRRPLDERNAMWRRLAAEHRRAPFSLLLQGGDQLYADEVVNQHPGLRAWDRCRTSHKQRHDFTPEMREVAERFYLGRYLTLYSQPGIAELCATAPSLMMWDDHDILDGWGSHPRATLESPVGVGLFTVARQAFTLFQLALTATEAEAAGPSLGYAASFPGFTIVAPDLRSERRPDRVMGEAGWANFERALAAGEAGDRLILMSSVPALGPRLSWVERLMVVFPGIRKYKDDLRDQWQSRAHRAEWKRFLQTLERQAVERGRRITVVSGEIHLATRGEMPFRDGGMLHQLVASGIAHPAPPAGYAIGLGLLATLGEDPLPGQPIVLRPLPGRGWTYAAERNYLVLDRSDGRWTASWELETGGRTGALAL